MAKQMSYTDPNTGVEYPASVWLPVGVYIDVSGPNVKIDFLGYKDKQTAAQVIGSSMGMPNMVKKGPIGTASYTLTQEEFATLATAPPDGASVLDAVSNICYVVADQSDQNRKPDPDDPENTLPYFYGATDVNIFAPQGTAGRKEASAGGKRQAPTTPTKPVPGRGPTTGRPSVPGSRRTGG